LCKSYSSLKAESAVALRVCAFSRASECEREACALDQLRLSDPQAKAVDPQIEPECELRRTAAATSRSVGP
jgi:hypothetical protein